MIIYYTDGSTAPTNPGPGGFSVIRDMQPHILGSEPGDTTNIRMEGMAILNAMVDSSGQECEIRTDSKFWIDVLTQWAPNWEKNGWKKRSGEIANLDLVKEIFYQFKLNPQAKLVHVRGHKGEPGNEMADEWANKAREGVRL
jgi:ribonuclease HI